MWPGGATVALNIAVNYEEGSERSYADGDGRNDGMGELPYLVAARDLATESVYEYGSRVGVWRLARVFEELEVPVTVFAAAVALERNAEVAAWIGEAGHEVCGHGWRWEEPWLLSREQERERIVWARESIARSVGSAPVGWYCRYGPSVHTRELLVEVGGFLYDADAYNDDLPYFVPVAGKRHLVVPYSLALNDGGFVRSPGLPTGRAWLDRQRRHLEELRRAGEPALMSVGLHPRWMGQPARAGALRALIDYASGLDDVWICRRCDVARHWIEARDGADGNPG